MAKTRKGYWIYLIYYSLAWLSLSQAHALAKGIARWLKWRNNRDYRTVQTNINACFPELPTSQKQALIEKAFVESCKGLLELPVIWSESSTNLERMIVSVEGEALLSQAVSADKGVMIICPHFGNWEILNTFIGNRTPAFTTLYKPSLFESLERIMVKARTRSGQKTAPTDKQGIKQLLAALAQRETIAILPDQDPGANGGDYVPFFGIQTNTMALCYKLAKRTACRVLFVYAQRLPNAQYAIRFERFPEWEQNPALTQIEFSSAMNASIEQAVRRYPDQYQWTYKRFRRSPDFKY